MVKIQVLRKNSQIHAISQAIIVHNFPDRVCHKEKGNDPGYRARGSQSACYLRRVRQ